MKNLFSLHYRRSLWGTTMGVFLAAVAFLVPAMPAQGQAVIATVPVGEGPWTLAVNPVTNKIYVIPGITVIDGATNSTTTVTDPNASSPVMVAVNPVTNKIYVANNSSNNVTVVDGATNSTTTVTDPNAQGPIAVAVNAVTNMIYVANGVSKNVTVIDGATNSTTTVTDPNAYYPQAMALNPVTNKIYVINDIANGGNITVIDGKTNSTTTVSDPNAISPCSVAVNPVTNKIYVANSGNNVTGNVTVIDGKTNSTTTVTDPNAGSPYVVAVNSATNKIYVLNFFSNLTVIDGATNSTTTVGVGGDDVAVNTVTNQIYVSNWGNPVAIINGATNSYTTVTDPNANSPANLAVNPATNKIYVVNNVSNNVTVIDGRAPTTLSPSGLSFGNQLLNTTGPPQTVTLTDIGEATLYISGIVASGDFAQTNTCGSSVSPGASCTIAVAFTPTAKSKETGTLTVRDNASAGPHMVSLTGFGSVAALSVHNLDFGDQQAGTTSSAETVTFTNYSTSLAVTIHAIGVSGLNSPAFAQTNNCGKSLAAGASCTISVTFTPHSKGSKTASLNVWNNGSGTVQQVVLTGYGT